MDKIVICKLCKTEFKLSDDQQAWFKAQGFSEPKRCKACRDKRRADKSGGAEKSGAGNTSGSGPAQGAEKRLFHG